MQNEERNGMYLILITWVLGWKMGAGGSGGKSDC
jgi:hypothetical protein